MMSANTKEILDHGADGIDDDAAGDTKGKVCLRWW